MKIKLIITKDEKEIYNLIKNNQNVIGIPMKIDNANIKDGKQENAIITLLSIMNINGYLEEAKSIVKDSDPLKIVKSMINIANKNIEDYLKNIENDSKYKINEIIRVNDKEYAVIDSFKNNDNTYLYLINNSDFNDDLAIIKEDNNGKFINIEKDDEFNFVLNKIFLDFKDEIINFATDN